MKIATVFSGIGSPEQAVKRVHKQHEIVFACEFDTYARESYLSNYPIDPQHFYKDVNDLDATQYRGKVDILVGGSPCQDFSIAGLQQGLEGKRGQLIWQYFRIVKEVMPPIFIYENVRGMVSDNKGKTLNDFLKVFRTLGYHCHAEVLNTKDYGVPQHRERIYIVGFLDKERYFRFQYAKKMKLQKTIKDVIEDEADDSFYLKNWIGHILDDAPCGTVIYQESRGFNRGGFHSICPTLTANSWECNNFLVEEKRVRKLTPRECLRLQDFSNSFKIVVSNSQTYKQAGNAMSVNVLEMLFRQIEASKTKTNLF